MKLFVGLLVVLGLLLGADFAARHVAEDQIADVVHARVAAAGPTSADISSFPFVGRLLAAGHVSRLTVRQQDVNAGPLRFAVITVDLHGVRVDRGRLLRRREVELTGIDQGTVTAELTQEAASGLLGARVLFARGRATANVAGIEVAVKASVEKGALVLRADGSDRELRLPIPDVPLLPCVDRVELEAGRAVLACTVHDVPPELLRTVRFRAALRQ
jgi:hypothetical protein